MSNRPKKQDIRIIVIILSLLILLFVGLKLVAFLLATVSIPEKERPAVSSSEATPSAVAQTE